MCAQEKATSVKDVEIELQFVEPEIEATIFNVTIQARVSALSLDLPAGGADLCFNYNVLGLKNPRILYKLNFSDTTTYYEEETGRTFQLYQQNYQALQSLGLFHLWITHILPAIPSEQYYSTLSKNWVSLAVIQFDLVSTTQNAALVWSSNPITYWLEKNNILSVNNFQYNNLSFPLPVEISSFTAIPMFNRVNVQWGTSSETNCYGFELQKALDIPAAYKVVTFIPGQGTTTIGHQYSYIDTSPSGTWYYRLMQIDLDGKRNPTAPILVSVTGKGSVMVKEYSLEQNYPNPFNAATAIVFSIPKPGMVNLKAHDLLGHEIPIINEKLDAGKHIRYFFSDKISSGMYLYTLEYANTTITKKMVLTK